MNRKRVFFRRFSQRLLFSNLLLFSLIILAFGTAAGIILSAYLGSNFKLQQSYRLEKMQQQLDGALDQLDRLSLSIVASRQIQDIFQTIPGDSAENYFLSHPRIREDVRDALFSFTAMKALTGRICLVSRYGDLVDLSNQQDTISFSKSELAQLVKKREAMLGGAFRSFLPPHGEPWSARGQIVVSLLRHIQDTEQVYGFLEVNQRIETLSWIWERPDGRGTEQIGLYDKTGRRLWASFDSAPRALDAGAAAKSGRMVFRSDLESVDWQLALFADTSAYRKPVAQTLAILVACLVLLFLVSAAFSWLSLRSITKPVRQLTDQVRKISDFETGFPAPLPTAPEEVVILGTAFGELLVELKREHEALLIAENHEISARMAALQAQLNPHFIFNTLTCISAYGKKADAVAVHEMCNGLSAMLRYTLENSGQATTLAQEIEQAENYLRLMAKRYNPYFSFTIVRAPRMEGIAVPRLLLQPLLENCFVHGFAESAGPWEIALACRIDGDSWLVEVRDNGQGIPDGRVEELLAEFGADGVERGTFFNRDFSTGRLGLLSSVVRLRLLYKDRARFDIDSACPGSCTVSLGGPLGDV
jgi:sensor histidine kinase YesM